MSFERKHSAVVSLFTLDDGVEAAAEDYIGDLIDATVTLDVETEDARALTDQFEFPVATAKKWSITANVLSNTSVGQTLLNRAQDAAETGGPTVAVVLKTNVTNGVYEGSAWVKSVAHKTSRGALQQYAVTLEGYSTLTFTATVS